MQSHQREKRATLRPLMLTDLFTADALVLPDPARAWDAALEAIKAANKAEKFTG